MPQARSRSPVAQCLCCEEAVPPQARTALQIITFRCTRHVISIRFHQPCLPGGGAGRASTQCLLAESPSMKPFQSATMSSFRPLCMNEFAIRNPKLLVMSIVHSQARSNLERPAASCPAGPSSSVISDHCIINCMTRMYVCGARAQFRGPG